MGRLIEERLAERRIWLVAALVTLALLAAVFHAFPSLPEPLARRAPQAPSVVLMPWRPAAGSAAQQAVRSPALIALPLRAGAARASRPGDTQTDARPSLETPAAAAFFRPLAPRDPGPSLDEWLGRLQRDRDRPPGLQARPGPRQAPSDEDARWGLYDGLAGLESDLVPLLQLGEEGVLPAGVLNAWLALDESGRVIRAMVEPPLADRALAGRLAQALRQCVFWPVAGPREGRLAIRFPPRP